MLNIFARSLLAAMMLIACTACGNADNTDFTTAAATTVTANSAGELAHSSASSEPDTFTAAEFTLTDTEQGKADTSFPSDGYDKTAAAAICAAMTADYTPEEQEHNAAAIFIYFWGPHWEPQYILSHWPDTFPFYELLLELDDPLYGTGQVHFSGCSLDDMLRIDAAGMVYHEGITAYDDNNHLLKLTREEIREQEIYLMGYCEGKLFGKRDDGECGPLVLMSTKDGKAEILMTKVVNISVQINFSKKDQ